MGLRTKLFLVFFTLSALLFGWAVLSLRQAQKNGEEESIRSSFQRSENQFAEFRFQRGQSLRLATQLIAQDPGLKTALASGNVSGLRFSPRVQELGVPTEVFFLAKKDGYLISSTLNAQEASRLEQALRRRLQTGDPSREPITVDLPLGPCLVAVSSSPNGWLGLGQRIGAPELEKLSQGIGVQHLLAVGGPRVAASSIPLSVRETEELLNLPPAVTREVLIGGSTYLARTEPLKDGDEARLILLLTMEPYKNADRRLWMGFVLGILVLGTLATLLANRLHQTITRPFQVIRQTAQEIGAENLPQDSDLDAFGEIAETYRDATVSLKEELREKSNSYSELQEYKSQLLKANSRLSRRLFENRVMLTLWSEQERSQDTKEFLSQLLEALLPGVPFDYGCIIIRPLAEIGPDMVFARVERNSRAGETHLDDGLEKKEQTLWISDLDPQLRDFLVARSHDSKSGKVLSLETTKGSLNSMSPATEVTVLTLALRQGKDYLGSLHLLTDAPAPRVGVSLQEFLTNVSAQVAVLLQIRALSYLMRVDPLTRLYNRGYMADRLREEVLRSSRTNNPFTFLLLDVDHFKKINDTHGHQAGDEMLMSLAALLKRKCRASDAICRYGGEEIAIILVDTPLSGAKIFAENLRKAVEIEPFAFEGKRIPLTVSMGLAEYPTHGGSGETLISRADHALYLAKNSGRNAWRSAEIS